MNRTYDSNMIYRVIKKHRTLRFGDSSDYMMRLMDLGNYNKSKGSVFEMLMITEDVKKNCIGMVIFSKCLCSATVPSY